MKKTIALLLATSLLTGCWMPPPPPDKGWPDAISSVPLPPGCHDVAWAPLNKVYEANFPNGALDSGYFDALHAPPQPMKYGDAGPDALGTYNKESAPDGALKLNVTAPDTIPPGQSPSAGVFSTGLMFGPGSIFIARATFQELDGHTFPPASDDITNAWAVGVAARTGDERDLGSETRMGATFRVLDQKKGRAKLSIQDSGVANALNKEDVRADIAAKVFGEKQPFTLELSVNRQTCTGAATLTTAGADPQTLPFRLHSFLALSGPLISAIGPTLADCCAPKADVHAEITNFQIWVPLPGSGWPTTEPNVPNPPPINPL